MGIQETLPHTIKTIYYKFWANIIINDEKIKAFPLRSGTRHGCPLLPLHLNIVSEVQITSFRQQKEIKGIQVKKEVKLSLFTDHMIQRIEKSQRLCQKNMLELINEFSKFAGYKINTWKLAAFISTNNKW